MAAPEAWSEQRLRMRLAAAEDRRYSWAAAARRGGPLAAARKAVVLIPLVIRQGRLFVWLTKRAAHLSSDPGDVAFPGGMRDAEDADEDDTCLREAREEVGLERKHVKLLARLLPRINRRQILITPVVGLLHPGFEPVNNPDEVEAAFLLPLDRFLSAERMTSSSYKSRGVNWIIHFFDDEVDGEKYRTWGLTASICLEMAIFLYGRAPEFDWDGTGINSVDNPFALQKVYVEAFIAQKGDPASKM